MRQGQTSFLERLSKALHLHYDDIAKEPLPRRWVDLIEYLHEEERKRSEDHHTGAGPHERRPPRKN
jgi:hypothetical protein